MSGTNKNDKRNGVPFLFVFKKIAIKGWMCYTVLAKQTESNGKGVFFILNFSIPKL